MLYLFLGLIAIGIIILILYIFAPLFLSSKNFQFLSSNYSTSINFEESCYPSPFNENVGIDSSNNNNNNNNKDYVYKPFGSVNEPSSKELSVIVPAYNENE